LELATQGDVVHPDPELSTHRLDGALITDAEGRGERDRFHLKALIQHHVQRERAIQAARQEDEDL
jgi:hypothetical protein